MSEDDKIECNDNLISILYFRFKLHSKIRLRCLRKNRAKSQISRNRQNRQNRNDSSENHFDFVDFVDFESEK